MENLTLLITFYKPKDREIKYWIKFYDKYREKIKIHFIIDNPNLDIEKFKLKVDSKDLFIQKKNNGKFLSIYNHIKNGNVNTKYFKTVDPDDLISFRKMKQIELDMSDDFIHSFNSIRVSEKLFDLIPKRIIFLFLPFFKKRKLNSFGTSWTILPTNPIFKYSGEVWRINVNEDQILGKIAFNNNGGKVINKEWSFYLYKNESGVSSSKNFSNYLNNLESTLKFNQENLYNENYKINWPNFNYYENLKKKYEVEISKLTLEDYFLWMKLKNKYFYCIGSNNDVFFDKNIAFPLNKNSNLESFFNNLDEINLHKKQITFWFILDKYSKELVNKVFDLNENKIDIRFIYINDYRNFSFLKNNDSIKNKKLFFPSLLSDEVKRILFIEDFSISINIIMETFKYFESNKNYANRILAKKKYKNEYFDTKIMMLNLEDLRKNQYDETIFNLSKRNPKKDANFLLNKMIKFETF